MTGKVRRLTICPARGSGMDFAEVKRVNDAVRTTAMRHRAAAAQVLAPLGLHPVQKVLLLGLHAHGPLTHDHLATAGSCEPSTITEGVRKQHNAGLFVRRPSPSDGRDTILELSEQCGSLVPDLQSAWC